MSDRIVARIRTVWPMVVGHAAAVIATWVSRALGVELDSLLVELVLLEVVSLVLSWAAWEVGTRLGRSPNPVSQRVGRWLVSMGRDTGAPTYPLKP
jgi:hypothetical protein